MHGRLRSSVRSKGELIIEEAKDSEGTLLGNKMKWSNDDEYIGVYTNNNSYTTNTTVESSDFYSATAFKHGSYNYTMISDQATNCSADVWTLKDVGVSHDERIALQKLLGFEAYCNAVSYALDPSVANYSWSNTIGTPWKTWLGTYNSHHQIDAQGQHHKHCGIRQRSDGCGELEQQCFQMHADNLWFARRLLPHRH